MVHSISRCQNMTYHTIMILLFLHTARTTSCCISKQCNACIKDDSESQWKSGKFKASPPKTLNRSSPKFARMITSRTPTTMQNFITIRLPLFVPQMCENLHRDLASFFGVSSDSVPPRPLRRFLQRVGIAALYMLRPCPSVHLSVTRWYCVKTNEATIMRFSPSGRTIILVSGQVKIVWKFAGDHP